MFWIDSSFKLCATHHWGQVINNVTPKPLLVHFFILYNISHLTRPNYLFSKIPFLYFFKCFKRFCPYFLGLRQDCESGSIPLICETIFVSTFDSQNVHICIKLWNVFVSNCEIIFVFSFNSRVRRQSLSFTFDFHSVLTWNNKVILMKKKKFKWKTHKWYLGNGTFDHRNGIPIILFHTVLNPQNLGKITSEPTSGQLLRIKHTYFS